MKNPIRSLLALLLILAALVAGCGGPSDSASAGGSVDAQLRDDNNWQVIRTADS